MKNFLLKNVKMLLYFLYLRAFKFSCSTELTMKKGFLTSGLGLMYTEMITFLILILQVPICFLQKHKRFSCTSQLMICIYCYKGRAETYVGRTCGPTPL